MRKAKSQNKIERFSDVARLEERLLLETPPTGQYMYDYKLDEAKNEDQTDKEFHKKFKINFADLPISSQTCHGLNQKGFVKMTQIQRCVIPHALVGRDILAASKTGSGKTLSYLIPIVEVLYRNRFIPMDGLGAIVLVPVRELAMQVFQVLNSFTKQMQLSIGLVIGGKGIQYQKEKIQNMNILVCTPGRLLQHLQETWGFETQNLKLLVLDEADMMLQMGFKESLVQILKSIPQRQTMLFSATLKQSIHSLAMLTLNSPQRVFLHSKESGHTDVTNMYETPLKLSQYYMVVQHQSKINTIYSFLKEHPRQKILVFLSTCKQVRFIYQAMRTFKLGCPIFQLHGRQQQKKRMAIFYTFCEKQYGILFCTNIASRGLDFPQVDWVVQADVPEDVETYVHRVGRTARFRREGRGLMLVDPSELKFMQILTGKNMQITKINQNPQRFYSITNSLQTRCIENPDLKYLAQRALVSYMRFIFKAPNKEVFNVHRVNPEKYAQSMGLNNAPIISFRKKSDQQKEADADGEPPKKKLSKVEKMRDKFKQKKEEKKKRFDLPSKDQDLPQQPFMKVKRTIVGDGSIKQLPTLSKNQMKKIKLDGHYAGKNKVVFDEDGNPQTHDDYIKSLYAMNVEKEVSTLADLADRVQENQQSDLKTQKQRIKDMRNKQRQKKRKFQQVMVEDEDEQQIAVLGSESEEEYE